MSGSTMLARGAGRDRGTLYAHSSGQTISTISARETGGTAGASSSGQTFSPSAARGTVRRTEDKKCRDEMSA